MSISTIILEIKESLRVAVGNVFHHLVDERHFTCRKLATLDIFTYYAAEDAAEIFVTGI
mgnify:CR=1 FL=1